MVSCLSKGVETKSQYVCGAMWTGISACRVFRCHSTWSLLWAGVKPRSRYDQVKVFFCMSRLVRFACCYCYSPSRVSSIGFCTISKSFPNESPACAAEMASLLRSILSNSHRKPICGCSNYFLKCRQDQFSSSSTKFADPIFLAASFVS